ncbi:4-O-methyltransferase 1 [Sparassis crispa]|uniref:4-O-methyltransferase 1 n=1 Tax=Sparassis crispa TaxID=139825 RepID=A0A401GN34_9APHY|nr:4-O-methyltransferase 1 [Sparassis crispa]GBE83628.1 4-O-methyltransferase 1 [Sparassis crispa]
MTTTFATLRALHALIGTALDDIERVYTDASAPGTPFSPFSPSAAFSPFSPTPFSPNSFAPYPSPSSPTSSLTDEDFLATMTFRPRSSASSSTTSTSASERSSPVADSASDAEADDDASAPVDVPSTPGRVRPPPILTSLSPASARNAGSRFRSGSTHSPVAVRAYPITPRTPHTGLAFSAIGPVTPPDSASFLDFPDPDVPFYNTPAKEGDHEVETLREMQMDSRERAEALMSHPAVISATNRLVAACGQLTASVQRPFLTLSDASMGYHLPSCLRFLEASHAVEILREAGPRGLHVRDLAKQIDALRRRNSDTGPSANEGQVGVDTAQLSHILRLLATHHITREVRPDVFANNRVSAALDSGRTCAELRDTPEGKYEGTNGIAAFIGLCTDELFKASAYLTDVFLPEPPASKPSAPAAGHPDAHHDNFPPAGEITAPLPAVPFNLAFSTPAPFFEWLERQDNAARLRRFGAAMTGTGSWEVPGAVLTGFPWQTLASGSLVVDVGGGIGSTSMLLARAFSHLKFVVQDRPQVVQMGEAAWRARCPELLDGGRAAFQAHDFFTPQPPLPPIIEKSIEPAASPRTPEGEDAPAVFLLRVITHDWPDELVTRILLHLRRAAGPYTRLLLADYVLPLACIDEDDEADVNSEPREDLPPGSVRTLAPEGSPLLANLGKANANAYWLDLTMRATFNAQERTLREIAALTLTAGWRVVQVTRAEGSVFGHIIAVPVDISPAALVLLDTPLPGVADGSSQENTQEMARSLGKARETFGSYVSLHSEDVLRMKRRGVPTTGGRRANASGAGGASAGGGRTLRKRRSTLVGRDPRVQPQTQAGGQSLLPAAEIGPAGGPATRGLRSMKSRGVLRERRAR